MHLLDNQGKRESNVLNHDAWEGAPRPETVTAIVRRDILLTIMLLFFDIFSKCLVDEWTRKTARAPRLILYMDRTLAEYIT